MVIVAIAGGTGSGKTTLSKKIIDKKISNLVKDNQNLKEKNDEIITQNQRLLARLEKLENIALKFQSSSEMISVATKD